jgi:hypothetical protein
MIRAKNLPDFCYSAIVGGVIEAASRSFPEFSKPRVGVDPAMSDHRLTKPQTIVTRKLAFILALAWLAFLPYAWGQNVVTNQFPILTPESSIHGPGERGVREHMPPLLLRTPSMIPPPFEAPIPFPQPEARTPLRLWMPSITPPR